MDKVLISHPDPMRDCRYSKLTVIETCTERNAERKRGKKREKETPRVFQSTHKFTQGRDRLVSGFVLQEELSKAHLLRTP
jgi:hypothetical protein